jgi:hypothetical protein
MHWITLGELARAVGFSPARFRRYAEEGILPAYKNPVLPGSEKRSWYYVDARDVEAWLAQTLSFPPQKIARILDELGIIPNNAF